MAYRLHCLLIDDICIRKQGGLATVAPVAAARVCVNFVDKQPSVCFA